MDEQKLGALALFCVLLLALVHVGDRMRIDSALSEREAFGRGLKSSIERLEDQARDFDVRRERLEAEARVRRAELRDRRDSLRRDLEAASSAAEERAVMAEQARLAGEAED